MDWDLKLGRVMEESAAGEEGLQPPGRRRRTALQGLQQVTCLVDGCTWDLNNCREYHRRHRVCERHSKTPVVLVGGEEQRFCQQCSRFHSLGEFDEVKRSCRKRLDGHNRRRRKTQPESVYLNSVSTAVSGTPPAATIFHSQPPPLFHHQLMRHPPLPPPMFAPSATTWPAPPFPPPQASFGYVGRQHDDESADIRRDGHIDCALSLLSSGTSTRVQTHPNLDYWQQQQQQGFEGGGCSSSAAGGSHCYGFDDDDSDGAPSRMFPFTWD